MQRYDLVIPSSLVGAGVVSLFLPALDGTLKTIVFSVALCCATAITLLSRKSRSSDISIQFKVSLKEISFVHYERGRNDRPETTDDVSEVYYQALEKFHNKKYSEAARLYSRAFELGRDYWPAKVNEGFCYQAIGKLDQALLKYKEVEERCPIPRFRRQVLGNSGDILMAMAGAASTKKEGNALIARAYEKYSSARAAEETFVSLYNLWQAASVIKRKDEATNLLTQLKTYPEFEQLPPDQQTPPNTPDKQGDKNES